MTMLLLARVGNESSLSTNAASERLSRVIILSLVSLRESFPPFPCTTRHSRQQATQPHKQPQPDCHAIPWTCKHDFFVPVTHPVMGESIAKYNKLQTDLLLCDIWGRAFGKEFGNLAQGGRVTHTPGTNSIFMLTHAAIRNIPRDRTVTYMRIVVDYRPQKADPNSAIEAVSFLKWH